MYHFFIPQDLKLIILIIVVVLIEFILAMAYNHMLGGRYANYFQYSELPKIKITWLGIMKQFSVSVVIAIFLIALTFLPKIPRIITVDFTILGYIYFSLAKIATIIVSTASVLMANSGLMEGKVVFKDKSLGREFTYTHIIYALVFTLLFIATFRLAFAGALYFTLASLLFKKQTINHTKKIIGS